jgi:uncharacterized membrane protein YraQ (UPF0718 family)
MLLILSLATLLVGPLLYRLARQRGNMLLLLDGFIFVTISGLVLLFFLPDSISLGGLTSLVFIVLGWFGPTLIEHLSQRAAKQVHIVALGLALTFFCLHAVIDGTALSPLGTAAHPLLPFAVILHRLPVGLTVWWLLRPGFGIVVASAVLGLVALMTAAGYSLGPLYGVGLNSQALAWFQAFVIGSLLHVVFHQPHLHDSELCHLPKPGRNRWAEGSGALLGLLLLVLVTGGGLSTAPSTETSLLVEEILPTFWQLAVESAPALLIAYLMAGMLNAFLPPSSIGWMRRGGIWNQSLRGMAIGLPFPICSCGVVPLYRTLIQQGAPTTAAMAFLISTPELGLDAVLLSIPLLGGQMTLIRVAAAVMVALLVGVVVGRLVRVAPSLGGVSDASTSVPETDSIAMKLKRGLKVGLGEVVDHTAPWILLGLAVAAVAEPFLNPAQLGIVPDLVQVPLLALLGMPVYVCASGATPLVAVLLFNGISPGAALAFLLTGPATNLTTFGLLGQLHGRRIALLFSLTVIALAVTLGLSVNLLFPAAGTNSLSRLEAGGASLWQTLCLVVLAVVYLWSLLRRGARKFVSELFFRENNVITLQPHSH